MTRVACIDIGTVTARLAVADVEGGRVVRLIKHSEICNLGEGVDATGRLRDDAIGRVFSDPEEGNATVLHFQLWKEKTKLDPLPWLE